VSISLSVVPSRNMLYPTLPLPTRPNPVDGNLTNVTATSMAHSQSVWGVFAQSKSDVSCSLTLAIAQAGSLEHVSLPFFDETCTRVCRAAVAQPQNNGDRWH